LKSDLNPKQGFRNNAVEVLYANQHLSTEASCLQLKIIQQRPLCEKRNQD